MVDAIEVLDKRIAEVSRLSEDRRKGGDLSTMYKLNTAYHWLTAARDEILATRPTPAAEGG